MKQKIAKFILYIYLNFIKENWDDTNVFGKIILYPAWFIKSMLIWIISPIFIPWYLFKQSKTYKEMVKKLTLISAQNQRQMNTLLSKQNLKNFK